MEPQAEVEPTWIELAGQKEEIDLFLVCDTTGSMGTYLPALKASLRQVFLAAKLLYHGRLMVHIVSYKDYCDGDRLLSSVSRRVGRNDAIVKFADDLQPTGGGDAPEAVKTAFNYVVMTVDEIRTTKPNSRALVFLYTDAPPHHKLTGSNNMQKEINAINDNPKYTAGHDWIGIQKSLQERDIPVFTFHSPTRDLLSPSLYALLGPTVILPNISTTTITKASMGLLLQLMNQQFDAKNEFTISKFTYNGQDYGPQCYLQDESMIPKASELTCTREPFVFAPIDYMYEYLDGLLPLFGRDVDFRNLVMKTFEVIFRPENVLAVTYNPIFGKLWRLCCRQRLDPRLDDLTTKLSQCVPQLDGNAKQKVSDWLEESYNDSPRIQDAISQVPSVQSCFILDSVSLTGVTSADLRSLARSPTPDVLRKVTNLLTHVQRIGSVGYNDDDGVPLYLPEALSNEDLFSFLPHLLHRGTTFSRRGAALLAMLCCFSNHAWLAPRANAYLKSIRGTWLSLDYAAEFPELFSAEFINIVHRGLEYLTPDEQFVYRQLFAVNRMRLTATKKVDLTTGFAPKKTSGLWPDRKARCHTCGYDTSLSIMVSPVLCAMCFTYGDDAPRLQAETSIQGNQSHMVECTDCHGLYAILQLKQLGTHPKCWYCRSKAPERPLMASCSNCRNHYIDPAGLYNMTLCPVCTDAPSRGTTSHSVKFFDLLDENRTLAVAFGWTMDVFKDNFVNLVFDKRLSLFKWFTSQDKALLLSGRPSTDQDDDEDVVVPLHYQGKIVHDTRNVCKNLQTVVLHDALRDTCLMCYDEYALDKLDSPCGRTCTAKVCDRCLKRWYRVIQPGKLVRWANLSCPFCRQAPKVGVLRKYNRDICALQRNDLTTMRADAYYGWCLSCFQVKPMGQRNCMTEPPHDVTDFHCEGCVNATQVHTIPCPKCQVLTEKIGGCNHMTCSNCGQHWCFECSAGFDSDDEVYEHLYAVHGGVGV